MTGFIVRFLQRFLAFNFLTIIGIFITAYYLNIEVLSQYSVFKILLNYKEFIQIYILNNEMSNTYFLTLFLMNLYILVWAIKNFRYLNLSFALGFFNQAKQFEGHQKRTKIYFDKFIKKVKNGDDSFSLYFKNWVSIEPVEYDKNKEKIAQYLGWDGDIKVYKYGKKGVDLYFYKLPEKYYFYKYQENNINFGKSINGDYLVPIDKLTHTIVVGESGSGKSNFMHHLLHSFIVSKESIKSVELIDLKGTELYPYRDIEYMNFIDDIEQVRDNLLTIKEEMKSRFEDMKQNAEQLYSGQFIFILIDEIGTIGTSPNKKLKDEIFNLMIEISQKGRAAKILFFIFAQKIDSTNIPSNVLANLQTRVLMKTDSDFNINNTIGKKEDLEKVTLLNPDSFPKGRAIVKDGFTSEKVLVQVPLITLKKEYR